MDKFYKTRILLLAMGLTTMGTTSAHAKSDDQSPTDNYSSWTKVEAEISILRGTVIDNINKSLLQLPMDDPDTSHLGGVNHNNQRYVC